MSRYVFKLPDLGEGTVEAEIVAWLVKLGDVVAEGQGVAEMSTDKAVVELPAPVAGRITERNGEPGDTIAVGAELIVIESDANIVEAHTVDAAASGDIPAAATQAVPPLRVMASPATRRRAREAGIDLATVQGSGPSGRIAPTDLSAAAPSASGGPQARVGSDEIKVLGVRRLIAQRMLQAKREIPHFAYVEEIDVTELEALREHLNSAATASGLRYTPLPFVIAALTRVLEQFPQCNAHYDAARETLIRHHAVHVGVATQTRDGLKVPVVRHAESLGLAALAGEIARVAEAARSNQATREMLTGSTITVTSLGKLGGIASTPIINSPEVAIIGLNRIVTRPVVHGGSIAVRQIMNLSSSFDHRFVDGYDAAAMIQALKSLLEHPATIFLPK